MCMFQGDTVEAACTVHRIEGKDTTVLWTGTTDALFLTQWRCKFWFRCGQVKQLGCFLHKIVNFSQ